MINKKQLLERSRFRHQRALDETDRLQERVDKLIKEKDALMERNTRLVKHNDLCKHSKRVYVTQERSLSTTLEQEIRSNGKLLEENRELKGLLKATKS